MMKPSYRLVLLRHGQSQWNQQNRFTGWEDVGLTAKGEQQARRAGELLKAEGFCFDRAYTSVLKRATRTLELCLEAMGRAGDLPIQKHWQLNERHYGALQGRNKAEVTQQHGAAQVKLWRRSADIRPPALALDAKNHPCNDARYADIPREQLPSGECLNDTANRVLPYWEANIQPRLLEGESLLIVAHGNSLRALYRHLAGLSDAEILQLDIPVGNPWVLGLNAEMRVLSSSYLKEDGLD